MVATTAIAMEPALAGLGVDGTLLVVGASHDPLALQTAAHS
ncbi:MAG: hypothetical protein ACXWNK_08535 [Vulcanimicrobiaceae bacterium]